MGRLDGKVAIVTGAARGQGEAEARLFAEEGASVVVADVLDDEGKAVADDIGERAVYAHVDVSSPEDWSAALDAAHSFGPVDVLVNNAAILIPGTIEEMPLEHYLAVVNVNQVGTFLGMQAVIPDMKSAGRGSIVNISSIDGLQSKNGLGAYTSTKFAIRGMTKTAAIELGPFGIRANSIHPGGVNTPMGNPMGLDDLDVVNEAYQGWALPRIGEPIEIAYVALFLASDESSYVTGAEISADGGVRCGYREGGLPGAAHLQMDGTGYNG